MSFKNAQQRKFLFALDSDKKKGVGQNPIQPSMNPAMSSNPMSHPQGLGAVPPIPKISMAQHASSMNPVAVPALPGLSKLPKFGKMKNSLKGPFKSTK